MAQKYRGRPLLLGAGVAIVLLGLGLGFRRYKAQPIVPSKTLSERQLTHNPSENLVIDAAISPDGKYLAYADPKGLHLSVIETGEVHDVPLPEELRTRLWYVTWFPDGERLLFMADSDAEGRVIWQTSVFGGTPRKLARSSNWPGPVVSPQGSLIAFGLDHEIWLMGAHGENPHRILCSENERYAALAWSPTGQRLAYIKAEGSVGGNIETLSLAGGPPSMVISDPQLESTGGPGLLWAGDGRIIFVSSLVPSANAANLWEITADPETGKPSGQSMRITDWDGVNFYSPTVSRDAKHLAVVKGHDRNDVYVGELKDGGKRLVSPKRLTLSESQNYSSGWMSDNKTILFGSNRNGRIQVFKQQLEQETAEPLIIGPDDEEFAEISSDRRWILYLSTVHGGDSPPTTKRLMRVLVLGGSPQQIMEVQYDRAGFDCPVAPAKPCVFGNWDRGQLIFYSLDPVQGRGKELASTNVSSSTNLDWRVSPDGLRIAVAIRDKLPEQVRILDLRNSTQRNLSLPHGWLSWDLIWTADGNALFEAAQSTTAHFIVRIELDGKTRILLVRDRSQWLGHPYPSTDGRHLAFTQQTRESNAWLLENF